MEIIHDTALLEQYFAALNMRARMPWLNHYPWQLLHYQKWEYLCSYREPLTRLILLLEGRVMVSMTTPQGRTRLVCSSPQGSLICGDVEVVLGTSLATVDLRTQGTEAFCASIMLEPHREALFSDLDFLRYGAQRLAQELVRGCLYSTNNLLFRLENRLAAYILNTAAEGVFRENLTRTAELMGASYRQLSRIMKGFLDRGFLEKVSGGWHLLDTDALDALSCGMDLLEE